EDIGNHAQILPTYVFDGEWTACHGGQTDPTSNLDHVRQHGMFRTRKAFDPFYFQQVGADSGNLGAHPVQHFAQLLQIGFTGRIVYCGGSLGKDRGHDNIGRTGHRGLLKEHKGALKGIGLHPIKVFLFIVSKFCPEFDESFKMGIQSTSSDLVPSGFGNISFAKPGQQGSHQHDGAPQGAAVFLELGGLQVLQIYVLCLKGIASLPLLFNLNTEVDQKLDQFVDIHDVGNVVYDNFFLGEQYGTNNLQCLVLCSLGSDFSLQLVSPFYSKCTHGSLWGLISFLSAPLLALLWAAIALPVALDRFVPEKLPTIGQVLPIAGQIDLSIAQFLQMSKDHGILHRVLVPVQVTFFHVVGNGKFQPGAHVSLLPFDRHVDHPFNVVAVKAILWVVLWIPQGFRTLLQYFPGGDRKGGIHIQSEIRHDEQLVPELVLEIRYIP